MSRRLLALGAIAVLPLAACVVLPLDPQTGHPYGGAAAVAVAPATASIVPPPAPVAPQPRSFSVRLYPVNAEANKAGLLQATVIDNQGGRGTFSVNYLGDNLQGEATRVDAGYAAFGRVHDDVLGPSQRSFGGTRGVANAFGSRGISAQCEFVMTGPGLGTGVCAFSDGAHYQMHFGS